MVPPSVDFMRNWLASTNSNGNASTNHSRRTELLNVDRLAFAGINVVEM
jgi:hypothetical protein